MAKRSSNSWTGYAPLDASGAVQFQAAVNDLQDGLRRWRSWGYLAVETVKNRYRRTVLGPWWLTLQMAVYVVALAIIFSQLLHTGLRSFLPYVAVGFIAYSLLVGVTRAGADVFITRSSTMKSTPQPLSSLVLRDVAVEFIQFGHNFVLYVLFVASGLVPLTPKMLIALPVLVLIAANALFLGLWLGIAAARFRDVQPLVMSILQVLIFFTPVFYKLNNLSPGARNALLAWNPFTYLLNAFRAPLIGAPLQTSFYVGAVAVTLINVCLGLAMFARTRSLLPYWVA